MPGINAAFMENQGSAPSRPGLERLFFIFIPRSPVFLIRLVFLGGKGLGWVFSKVFGGSVNWLKTGMRSGF